MPLNEMQERWIRDLKYLEENHAKEMENYEKYFNKETFDKIVNKLKENKNYLIKFDDFYDEDKKFLGTIDIINKNNDIKVYFKLFDFGSPDCRVDMEEYLKGNLYSLDIKLSFDILPLYKQGEEKPFMNNLVEIDLNKLKSYNLENTLVDQLISVINEMSEFEVVSEFDEETELINREELIENREQIIKSGLKVISELYKFFVKLGFNNEEINKWIGEVNGN